MIMNYKMFMGVFTVSVFSCSATDHLSGFNISAGIGMSNHNSNPIFESHRLTSSEALIDDIVDGDRLNVDFVYNGFDPQDPRDLSRTFNKKFSRNKSRLFEGNLAIGYGKVFKDKIYTGLNLTLDMTKNSKKTKDDSIQIDTSDPNNAPGIVASSGNFGMITNKVRGINPTLAFKFGLVCQKLNAVFYGRVGVRHVSSKLISKEGGSLKMSKITPALGFGFEKYLQKFPNTFVRFEGDYYLKVKKSGRFIKENITVAATDTTGFNEKDPKYTRTAAVKNKLDGYVIRLALGRSF